VEREITDSLREVRRRVQVSMRHFAPFRRESGECVVEDLGARFGLYQSPEEGGVTQLEFFDLGLRVSHSSQASFVVPWDEIVDSPVLAAAKEKVSGIYLDLRDGSRIAIPLSARRGKLIDALSVATALKQVPLAFRAGH
jgi:hypothetical protein